MSKVYILSGARTPIGSYMGQLSTVSAPKLGANAITEAVKRSTLSPEAIEEVYMGNVVQAGVGQAPARQATLFAKLPESTPATTINKVCGSGLAATILGAKAIALGDAKCVATGGMENMSLAPHILPQSRLGFKYGSFEAKDSMQWDGLWDVYTDRPMGNCAEECVSKYGFSREEQDQFAIESYNRSLKSIRDGTFKVEISSVEVNLGKDKQIVSIDEEPGKVKFEKIPSLKPAFLGNGTITAANASSINDGAACVILGGEQYKNLAKFKIVSYAGHAQNPTWFTTAPVSAMKKCLEKCSLKLSDIDFFEINEAFSVVTMSCMKDLGLSKDRVNVLGGAASLGHPIGATGARLIVTMMNVLTINKAKRGMISLCIGGGEGLAMIIEKL